MRFNREPVLSVAMVVIAVLTGGVLGIPSLAEACPIETENVRKAESYGPALPDCRAYEQVSPVDKNTTDAAGRPGLVQSSPSGESVSYYSIVPFSVALTAPEWPIYLSTRAQGGWSTQELEAPVEPAGEAHVIGLTEDNGEALDRVTAELNESFLLASGAKIEYPNVYVRDNATGEYKLLATELTYGDFTYADSTSDGSHILFTSILHELVPGVVDEERKPFLYEWDRETGQISFVGYVGVNAPDEGTVAGSNEGEYSTDYHQHTIAGDGSRIFFSEKGESRKVYMREPEANRTIEISTGEAQWRAATPSGSFALYTEGEELYRFNVANDGNPSQARENLTGAGAKVLGTVGMSDDGSYAYFVAEGVLAANENGNAETAQAGEPNLYEWHEGAITPITFIARLSPETDMTDWVGFAEPSLGGPEKGYKASRVSADGKSVLVDSTSLLIKYTNSEDIQYNNRGNDELYLYDASSGRLGCISCDLSKGSAEFQTYLSENDAGSVPAETRINALTRNLSAKGTRVFFQTEEELLPQANAQMNVYEWEREGTGSCGIEEGEAQSDGCLYLLSNGQSSTGAYFGDASENGEDVFFFTRQSLVGQDRDNNVDVFDAREDGGIAAQNPEPASASCVGEEACRGSESVSGPVFGAPFSATFSGAGNLAPPPAPLPPAVVKPKQKPVQCKKPKKLSHGKCIKKPKPKKRAKKSIRRQGSK